jgi:hypothetical protein
LANASMVRGWQKYSYLEYGQMGATYI